MKRVTNVLTFGAGRVPPSGFCINGIFLLSVLTQRLLVRICQYEACGPRSRHYLHTLEAVLLIQPTDWLIPSHTICL